MNQKKQLYSFEGSDDIMISYSSYLSRRGGDNSAVREIMKRVLKRAIVGELTERQRLCLTEYYFGRKTQTQIARELGITRSTVCRHISVAKRHLKKIADYYAGS